MLEFIFKKRIETIIKKESKCSAFDYENLNILIDSDDFTLDIDNSDIIYLLSEKIDIPTTARVIIESSDNFIFFSKTEYENDRVAELQKFSDYINIKTENYGNNFVPYKIKLLKITPFNE